MFNLKKAVTVLLGATILLTGAADVAAAQATEGRGASATAKTQGQSLQQALAKLESKASGRETSGVSAMTAGEETFDCTYNVNLQSRANEKYVSAEFAYWGGGYAMLRARSGGVGDWESFSMCRHADGYYSFQSKANGQWVSAELHYTGNDYGMLRATAPWAKSWEKFKIVPGANGGKALKNLGNGRYVSAELDYWGSSNGMLRARAYNVGLWETFA